MSKPDDILDEVGMGLCGVKSRMVMAENLSGPERRMSMQHAIDEILSLRGLLKKAALVIGGELYKPRQSGHGNGN
jgi:hypothetical protein